MGIKIAEMKKLNANYKNGVWVPLPHLDPDAAVKVRPRYNPEFKKLFEKLLRNAQPAQRENDQFVREAEEKCLKETCILDWKGFDDLPYSKKNIEMLATNPDLEVIWDSLKTATGTALGMLRDTVEESSKNS